MIGTAHREDSLLGAAGLLVATRTANSGVELVRVERFAERDGLHLAGPDGRSRPDRMDAVLKRLLVSVDDQVEIEFRFHALAMRDHVPELPGGIDMQRGEWYFRRMEGLAAQMQQDARILADLIHQHRAFERRRGLAQDDNGFRLETGQMAGQIARHETLAGEKFYNRDSDRGANFRFAI